MVRVSLSRISAPNTGTRYSRFISSTWPNREVSRTTPETISTADDRVEDRDVLGVMMGFYTAADGSYKSADDPEVLEYVSKRWRDPAKRHIFTPEECGASVKSTRGAKAPIIRRIFPSEARLAADFPNILEHPGRRIFYTFGYWGKAVKRKLSRSR